MENNQVGYNKKVVLVILDGWGIAPAWGGNAIEMANTPTMDQTWRKFPHTLLKAAEESVGLPHHEPGNSEVGHLNIGCGQIIYQNLPGITATIENGSFFQNETILQALSHVKKNGSNLHLLGLVSDGGIHSHRNHLYALLEMAKKNGVEKVYIHMITDGRDTDPMKALSYAGDLKNKIAELRVGRIVSVMGRYWAMDRDKHWDRIQKAYDVIAKGIGPTAQTIEGAISENYRANHTDEFIIPTIIQNENEPTQVLEDNDALIFFNFRADRTREITRALTDKSFRIFARKPLPNFYFATFAFLDEYSLTDEVKTVFKLKDKNFPLAKVLADAGLKQFHIAETEKYAHVTFFFNGGQEKNFSNETRILVPSPKVATFDMKPEMSAEEITKKLINEYHKYDFTVCNFANPDMVGHTGNIKAAVRACEKIDELLAKIIDTIVDRDHVLIITADHGNVEQMLNPATGEAYTEHTINPVPFILCCEDERLQRPLRQAVGDNLLKLADISPTIIELMGLEKPQEMTGQSLLADHE